MQFLNWIWSFIRDFVGTPALLVGMFVLIGALVQRKKFSQIVISCFKVTVGFLILGGGAGVLVGSLNKFQPVFSATYGLQGIIPNNDAFAGTIAKALPSIGNLGSTIMLVGMLLNIVLAATSRFKYVYLSGHVLYYMSLMVAIVMYTVGMDFENNVGDWVIALFSGAFIMGLYMTLSPAVQQRYVKQIIGTDEIALGHTGGFGYALSGLIGEAIGKIKKGKVLSTEEIKFPQSLFFFRNTLVSISITVFIFYLAAFLPAGIMYEIGHEKIVGNAEVVKILESPNWGITLIVQAFTFTAGVEIILVGVRLFVGELVPMFKGISEKLIKNSKAAVDCPVVFPYAPNAVIIGFISSFLAGLVGMGITIGLGHGAIIPAVILPGLVPHFFLGATAGVFGNVRGGVLGAIIGPAIGGLIITFVPVVFLLGQWVPATNDTLKALAASQGETNINSLNWGDTDYLIGAIPGILGLAGKTVGKWLIFASGLIISLGLIIDGTIKRFRDKNKKEVMA